MCRNRARRKEICQIFFMNIFQTRVNHKSSKIPSIYRNTHIKECVYLCIMFVLLSKIPDKEDMAKNIAIIYRVLYFSIHSRNLKISSKSPYLQAVRDSFYNSLMTPRIRTLLTYFVNQFARDKIYIFRNF